MLDDEALSFLWILTVMNYWMRENGYADDKWFWADAILFKEGYTVDLNGNLLARGGLN